MSSRNAATKRDLFNHPFSVSLGSPASIPGRRSFLKRDVQVLSQPAEMSSRRVSIVSPFFPTVASRARASMRAANFLSS